MTPFPPILTAAALTVAALVTAAPAIAQEQQYPSPDGRHIARVVPMDGDWRRIDVVDARSGAVREQLNRVAYTTVAWAPDSSGFYYSRMPPLPAGFPAPPAGSPPRGFHEVDFHRAGTPQGEDQLVYSTDRFTMLHKVVNVTQDGRWLVIASTPGQEPVHEITLIERTAAVPAPWKLLRDMKNAWHFAGSRGSQFYFVTSLDAPRNRLVAIDIDATRLAVREVVPQAADTLQSAAVTPKGVELTYANGKTTLPLEAAP